MLTTVNKLNLIIAISTIVMTTPASADSASSKDRQSGISAVMVVGSSQAGTSEFQRGVYSQLFYEAKRCLESGVEVERLNNDVTICNSKAYGKADPQECANRKKQLDAKIQLTGTQSNLVACSKDPQVLQARYGDATVEAASAGDKDAQICYVEGQWSTSSNKESALYRGKAELYMKQAFARGDWRVVQLLTIPSESVGHGGAGRLVNLPIIGSPFTVYRANRLLEFGATGQYLDLVKSQAQDAKASLSQAQIENANTWAWQEFKRHFTTSPKLSTQPIPCLTYATPVP
ncbi:hypothetical protein [Rhodanobacter terrae]|uniref:Secreted protein n=1 Tax=Rhodanobacter terrae TaxID=418647 RepID=A0ABW0T0F1_9GAMM